MSKCKKTSKLNCPGHLEISVLHKDHEKRAPYKCERCAFATHSPLWLKRHVQRVHEKVSEIRLYDKFLILIRFMKFEAFDKN